MPTRQILSKLCLNLVAKRHRLSVIPGSRTLVVSRRRAGIVKLSRHLGFSGSKLLHVQTVRFASMTIAFFLVLPAAARAEGPAEIAPPPLSNWLSPELTTHSLVGLIWSKSAGKFITPRTFIHQLQSNDLVMLGERHDNADHHRLQGWVVSQMAKFDPRAVGFEMLNENVSKALKPFENVEQFRKAVAWDTSGWPEFGTYQPLFEAVIASRSKVLAIHPSRKRLMSLMRSPASEEEKSWGRFSEAGLKTLQEDIKGSHCGYANERTVEMMTRAQRFKDHWMTEQMVKQSGKTKGIIIAGNGHVRRDYGLPNHSSTAAATVGFLEVQEKKAQASDYAIDLFDYTWFTPRWDSVDPCVKYKDQLEKIKSHYKKKRSAEASSNQN